MNKKLVLIFILFIIVSVNGFTTIFDNIQPSSKAIGMGGAFTAYNAGVEGVFYNPATLYGLDHISLFLSYKRPFSFDFINESIFSAGYNLKKLGVIGIGYQGVTVSKDSTVLESEQTMILSYANSFYADRNATFNAGISLKYFGLKFKDYGNASNFSVDFGIYAKVGKRTALGFSLKDLNTPEFGKTFKEAVPSKMSFAISYEPYYGAITAIELEKNEYDPARVHAGGEFGILKFLKLRFGMATMPTTLNTGFTVSYSLINIDYGLEYHNVLGLTHHFGFSVVL